jgi:hypothetical protein
VDLHPGTRFGQRWLSAPTARARSYSPGDGDRIDPGRLIESAFRGRNQADDPETYILAWLTLLPVPADVPRSAAILSGRLLRLRTGTRSTWQRRLLELLAFVARHRRAAPTPPIFQSLSKKGTS